MGLRFTKMHGLGNDYVYVDLFDQPTTRDWPAVARAVSDRHFGIGGDGLILVCPGTDAKVRMRIFNADGSEAEMCGNGLRCASKYAFEHGLLEDELVDPPAGLARATGTADATDGVWRSAPIQTGAGVLTVALHVTDAGVVDLVGVDMGPAILEAERIPTVLPGDPVVRASLSAAGERFETTCVSMGNPHAVIFVDDLDSVNLDEVGPAIENHAAFPQRTNVHLARVDSPDHLTMITWERGSGRTLACGTGACAVCVAGVLEERSGPSATIELPGGNLSIAWDRDANRVYMLGPATEAFTGAWPENGV